MDDNAPLWARMGQMLLDLLFPPWCVGCRRSGTWLCSSCLHQVGRAGEAVCPRCGRPYGGVGVCPACRRQDLVLESARAPYVFEGAIQKAVHGLKYRGRRVLAEPLGELLAEYLRTLSWPISTITAVPLHRQRERVRGYNQAGLLARILARRTGWPLLEDRLVRWRDTPPQVGLDGQARLENVRGAFRWESEQPPPGQVILVDDVYTTGATMEACAGALRAAGATEVRGLALAQPRQAQQDVKA